MGSKKKMFMVCGEEIGVEAFEKIGKDAIENYKIEMAQKVVKKEYECSVCKISPRPSTKNVRKCTYCTKVFCDSCSSHQCPRYENGQRQIIADSTVEITLTINLDVAKYMSYFCKNNKFGCKEILKNQAKLLEHEECCDFQIIHCADISCQTEVCYLNYLDHFKEKHSSCKNLGDGKVFQSPIDFIKTQIPSVGSDNMKKCIVCLKLFYYQPNSREAGVVKENNEKDKDSVIIDLSHGLLKTTGVCPNCPKVSASFDPFYHLSVPIPKVRQIECFLMPIDQSVPIQFKVTVPKHGSMLDLCKALASMVEGVNGDNLIVTDVYNRSNVEGSNHEFHKIFNQDEGNLL